MLVVTGDRLQDRKIGRSPRPAARRHGRPRTTSRHGQITIMAWPLYCPTSAADPSGAIPMQEACSPWEMQVHARLATSITERKLGSADETRAYRPSGVSTIPLGP